MDPKKVGERILSSRNMCLNSFLTIFFFETVLLINFACHLVNSDFSILFNRLGLTQPLIWHRKYSYARLLFSPA